MVHSSGVIVNCYNNWAADIETNESDGYLKNSKKHQESAQYGFMLLIDLATFTLLSAVFSETSVAFVRWQPAGRVFAGSLKFLFFSSAT